MKNNRNKIKQRILALLTREEMEFIDKLGMDSLFSTGTKLSRTNAISALVEAAMALEISGYGIRTKEELARRIINPASLQVERRKYPRLKKHLYVGFRNMDSLKKYEVGTAKDIGMGGFSMDIGYLGHPPSLHQIIEVTLKDPEEDQTREPVKAIGRIAWTREKEGTNDLEIGIMLTYIRDEDKARFMSYLSEDENKKRNSEGNKMRAKRASP